MKLSQETVDSSEVLPPFSGRNVSPKLAHFLGGSSTASLSSVPSLEAAVGADSTSQISTDGDHSWSFTTGSATTTKAPYRIYAGSAEAAKNPQPQKLYVSNFPSMEMPRRERSSELIAIRPPANGLQLDKDKTDGQ